jgi:signal transduction histidine kinase
MAARMRAFDWSESALGPVTRWPDSLRRALGSMLESSSAVAITWGPEFRLLYNDGCRHVLGAAKHPRALGSTAREIFPESWDRLGPQLARARGGEVLAIEDFELPLRRSEQLENCWFAFSSSPIREPAGNVSGVLTVLQETTARVEAERRLATLRDLLRRGLDGSSLEQICRRAARVFEGNRVDVPFALIYLLSDDGCAARRACCVGLAASHPANVLSLDRHGRAQSWPIFEVSETGRALSLGDLGARFGPISGGAYAESTQTALLVPIAVQDGRARGPRRTRAVLVVGASPRRALDRSYRAFFELSARQIAVGLGRVEARQRERERTRALFEAERANGAKDEFLALLGHELRNPLAPILTAIELMKIKDAKVLERERNVIERQVRHMVQLVDDLLDVSRVTRGKVQLRLEPIEIAPVIAQAVETVAPLLEQRQHRLSVSVPKTGLLVRGDAFRLAQVFANLLMNSAKYTPAGGKIAIHAARSGERVEISVRDDGSGITRAMLERIFEPFVQGQRSSDVGSGGLGLGLPLVRSLVALHEGSVRAESEGPGQGSEFIVDLPLLAQVSSSAGQHVEGQLCATVEAAKRRLLVVDDNADAAEMMAEGLRVLGYSVHAAYDAQSALAVARSFRPDYAVLDIGLPAMDGYELGRRLREFLGEGLTLVAVTGYAQDGDRERSRREDFADHLVKPIDLGVLARVLDAARAK